MYKNCFMCFGCTIVSFVFPRLSINLMCLSNSISSRTEPSKTDIEKMVVGFIGPDHTPYRREYFQFPLVNSLLLNMSNFQPDT